MSVACHANASDATPAPPRTATHHGGSQSNRDKLPLREQKIEINKPHRVMLPLYDISPSALTFETKRQRPNTTEVEVGNLFSRHGLHRSRRQRAGFKQQWPGTASQAASKILIRATRLHQIGPASAEKSCEGACFYWLNCWLFCCDVSDRQ
jgi:hypothetical protein